MVAIIMIIMINYNDIIYKIKLNVSLITYVIRVKPWILRVLKS